MSRIGRKIINIPQGTEVTVNDGLLSVKGPKGTVSKNFKNNVSIKIENNEISLTPKNQADNALWGTYGSQIKSMIAGVNTLFVKKLILEGIGYKSAVVGNVLDLALGFSHPVKIEIPSGLTVTAEKNLISISGIDKEMVGQFSAYVRSLKKPEPYKGKGFRYDDEVIRRKQGKKSA
jgi:large subunit ribosomal protein L6